MTDRYESPLVTRYASAEMSSLFSQDNRYRTWRKLWAVLARTEMELGLPVTREQVDELFAHVEDIDYEAVRRREREVRHDVMAHVWAYGKAAPSAAGIIHLGATSCYVTDNADLIIYRDALKLIRSEAVRLLRLLSEAAARYADLPVPGYTHYQPAQPVTAGKRICLWMQDLLEDVRELDFVAQGMKFLGSRGATGTEASYMELFGGDGGRIDEMNRRIAENFGFTECYPVCGQTYPRKLDARIVRVLSSFGESCYRMAQDIRLLQHDGQMEEAFAEGQIGSSAMPYKRNPMHCERICSLSRYLMSLPADAAMTASSQWLERTLDDSAGRRIVMPEAFLCADSVLRLACGVVSGLKVNAKRADAALRAYLPFMATENILMEAVKRGGDRQQLHERIRGITVRAAQAADEGDDPDVLDLLAADGALGLSRDELERMMDPALYVGRCAEQVKAFLEETAPFLDADTATGTDIDL